MLRVDTLCASAEPGLGTSFDEFFDVFLLNAHFLKIMGTNIRKKSLVSNTGNQ
jgi:hypothetical protein